MMTEKQQKPESDARPDVEAVFKYVEESLTPPSESRSEGEGDS